MEKLKRLSEKTYYEYYKRCRCRGFRGCPQRGNNCRRGDKKYTETLKHEGVQGNRKRRNACYQARTIRNGQGNPWNSCTEIRVSDTADWAKELLTACQREVDVPLRGLSVELAELQIVLAKWMRIRAR